MEDIIKAFQIFLKYGNPKNPTHCEHDVLYICGINPDEVSKEDKRTLYKLGFDIEDNQFISYEFG